MSSTETGTHADTTTPDRAGALVTTGTLPLASGRESLAVLWPLLKERRLYLILVCLTGLVASVAGLVAPWVIGWLVDVLPGSQNYTAVWVGRGGDRRRRHRGRRLRLGRPGVARPVDRTHGGSAARDGDGPLPAVGRRADGDHRDR